MSKKIFGGKKKKAAASSSATPEYKGPKVRPLTADEAMKHDPRGKKKLSSIPSAILGGFKTLLQDKLGG